MDPHLEIYLAVPTLNRTFHTCVYLTNTSVSELQEKYNFLIYNIHQGEGSGLRSSRCRQTTEQSRSSLSESRKIRRSRKVKLYLHKYLEIECSNIAILSCTNIHG